MSGCGSPTTPSLHSPSGGKGAFSDFGCRDNQLLGGSWHARNPCSLQTRPRMPPKLTLKAPPCFGGSDGGFCENELLARDSSCSDGSLPVTLFSLATVESCVPHRNTVTPPLYMAAMTKKLLSPGICAAFGIFRPCPRTFRWEPFPVRMRLKLIKRFRA